ncbi:hypothetical protein [Nocardioides caricicola]|uniref:Transposase n=1 Tax=Nocardioides caricicola TaxID=634770 RepID=A0ABW0N5W2_9ACTN
MPRKLNWIADLCVNGSIQALKEARDSYARDAARWRRERRRADPNRAVERIHGQLAAAYAFRTSDASGAGRMAQWVRLVESGLDPGMAVQAVYAINCDAGPTI